MEINLPSGKMYYSIGEVASAFGENTSLIRYWEKEFEIIRPKKNARGVRLFTREDIKNLKIIYHLLKEKGFTIDGANKHIALHLDQEKKRLEALEKLSSIRAQLIEISDSLD